MADKFNRLIVYGYWLFIFLLTGQQMKIVAQDAIQPENSQKNYFIQETDTGSTLVQRLSWEKLDDIYGFRFELERQDRKTGEWSQIEQKTIKINYIDVSLPPGRYRYKVQVINLLEQMEEASDYRNFDIRIAYQPELTAVFPQIINFDELEESTLTITGKNFHEETSFTLTNALTGVVLHGVISEINEEGTNAVVAFEFNRVNPGTYTFAAVDPSTLSAEIPDIIFRFQKPIDIFLSGGYFFNGFIGNRILGQENYFNTNIAPLGGGVRLTVAPIKRYYGNFGFNFTGSGTFLKNKGNGYTLQAGLLFAQLNAAYFLPIIKHRLVFDLHAGFGTLFMVNTQFTYEAEEETVSDKTWYWGLTADIGTALYVYVYKKLYVEINLDHLIPIRQGNGFPTYIIQPQLGIGWEF